MNIVDFLIVMYFIGSIVAASMCAGYYKEDNATLNIKTMIWNMFWSLLLSWLVVGYIAGRSWSRLE
jgi:hypothetical protein